MDNIQDSVFFRPYVGPRKNFLGPTGNREKSTLKVQKMNFLQIWLKIVDFLNKILKEIKSESSSTDKTADILIKSLS